jgi:hypothetical protein
LGVSKLRRYVFIKMQNIKTAKKSLKHMWHSLNTDKVDFLGIFVVINATFISNKPCSFFGCMSAYDVHTKMFPYFQDLLNDAEQSMMEYRASIAKLKKDSKYTLDKISIGESDLQCGRNDLR